jgi:hypothetical protein
LKKHHGLGIDIAFVRCLQGFSRYSGYNQNPKSWWPSAFQIEEVIRLGDIREDGLEDGNDDGLEGE